MSFSGPTLLQAVAGAGVAYLVFVTFFRPLSVHPLPPAPVYIEHGGVPLKARGPSEAGYARGGPLLGSSALHQGGRPLYGHGDSWQAMGY